MTLKKRLLWISLLAAVLFAGMYLSVPKDVVSACGVAGDVTIYCKKFDGDCIASGNGVIVSCTSGQYRAFLARAEGVDGVSLSFRGEVADAERLLRKLDVSVAFCEKIEDIFIVYGYSSRVTGGVYVDGKRMNVQVAVHGGRVYVGSPLLLGSF